jgi:hypothetical protein
MDARVGSAALHQHVVAVSRPGMRQSGRYHGLAMTSTAQLRVRDDVLEEPRVAFRHAAGSVL